MMKLLFLLIFLIPTCLNWNIFMWSLLSSMTFFMYLNISFNYPNELSWGLGMDLVSYWMIFLTLWIGVLMLLASFKIKFLHFYKLEFILLINMMMIILVLIFSTTNLFFFYFWFESIIIPTLFLIFGWGYQPERLTAGFYLLFYTLFASLPMLICIFYINYNNGTLFFPLINLSYFNGFLYLGLVLAFLVKMPMFFTHFWLPKAHVEAPVSGSMILAGVLLKLGGYGLFRVLSFIPYNSFNYLFIIVSLFGSVVVGLFCLIQVDMKSLIAYSSVAHMSLVIGGVMTYNYYGLCGSLVLMLGHGLCSSGLFSLSNISYERSYSRSILINKGILTFMPSISLFWFLLSINNMSSPPSLNLLGEIFLINSLMSWSLMSFLFLFISSFLSCCYSIYLFSYINHGLIYSGLNSQSYINIREFILILMHLIPLNILFMKSDIFTLWI
uniref:NADH-ubiquinone oxidoreductase chain 4 n=1 Tax=Piesma cf. maculatum TaxID=2931304 RepID=A0A8T9ZX17_9HEMI|nr:NADH dehydrogenase subunit 4 [Piesma cf. maculatum]